MHTSTVDSDEVVFETGVYLSKALEKSLYLFQYPTKICNAVEKSEEEVLLARIKPEHQKVELEIGLNVNSDTYDISRGEEIAFNVDGQNTNGETYFKSPYMDKYVIAGGKATISPEHYALGFLKNGEFHITPLHSILDLRPRFVHIDKMDSQAKKSQEPDEDKEEAEAEAVAVTVRFEGANTERAKEVREKSFEYHQHKSAAEAWINLNYHPVNSNLSKSERQKLICSQMYKDAITDIITPQDYLKDLLPDCLHLSGHNAEEDEKDQIISHKPLSDQIKYFLINAHVLTFSMLLKKLAADIDCASVERLLHQVAVLVRGCWAVKSELLYPEEFVSPYTGVNSKTLVNARDFVLWLFTKSAVIARKEVLTAIRLPNEDFKSIITPLANENNRCWEFKFSEDKEFIESYPEIYERQNMKWDLRYKKLVKDLNLGMHEAENFSTSPTKVPYILASRPRQKRHSRSSQSEGDESGTDSAYGTKDHKAKRAYVPKKNSPISPSKSGTKGKQFQFATLDISPTFLETSPPADVMVELKEFVGDILRTQFCMLLSEIKELVAQSHLSNIVNRSDFVKLLEDALLECGAQKLNNKWPQNTTPETLYAFTKFGNKLDRYRNALLDLFSTTARARINLFVKKIEDELREIVSEADCRLLFEEYCVYKSGFYYLKGTIAPDT